MGKIIVPNFSQPKKLGTIIIPIGIELLSPTFLGTKIPKKLGTIIKFLWEKLGTIIIPIGIELLSPTFFGDKTSQKVGDNN